MRRVNEAVRAVVAEGVGELQDPRIGLVTVTGVSISPDLREGTVYVSVLGGERKRTATLAGLESAHAVLQARIARELRLKRTPHLSFEYDPSVERGVRMTKLIDELADEGGESGTAAGHEPEDADAADERGRGDERD
jgi:ribosome-binding factor A